MNIVICDDVEREAQATAQCVRDYYQQQQLSLPQITIVENGDALRKEKTMDILFLDIELKEESGIALAAEINRTNPDTVVVFVTNYSLYVTDSYDVQVAQFLVKPLNATVFQRAFQRVLTRYEAGQVQFTRKSNGEVLFFRKDQVVYIESLKRILTVVLADGKQQQYYGKISGEEQFFAGSTIVRCHKSFLVNLVYVRNINRDGITVQLHSQREQTVPVGETWYNAVRQAFLAHMCH